MISPLSHRFETALGFAFRLHKNQYRKQSKIPYISHLLAVTSIVLDNDGTENQAIAEKWIQYIDSGKTFNELVEESTNNPFIRLNNSSFHWGDGTVPLEIENIAYQLKLGESSDL